MEWQIQPTFMPPEDLLAVIQHYTPGPEAQWVAQLLAQRGWGDRATVSRKAIQGFLDPQHYTPQPPEAWGQEMTLAVERIQQAYDRQEKIAIWGDFDADGVTATAVLWQGLSHWFTPDTQMDLSAQEGGRSAQRTSHPLVQSTQLTYWIPNRLQDSHGLSSHGLEQLAKAGCQLVITCDTGSTNLAEIELANSLGVDLIITDHHTLPETRPNVVAIVNPRYFPREHPLAHLSGVAVAYKLLESLSVALPAADLNLDDLLDLVAIGLIADLVELQGDCRYLAQRGLTKLQELTTPAGRSRRPGVALLLERCQRSGDRPSDIAFGLGPRINAVSRIQGDARLAVELLTSTDLQRCRHLAEQVELLNTRRRELQRTLLSQLQQQLNHTDLSTTAVLVLAEVGWPVGILGLVASQLAKDLNRPVVLLSIDEAPSPQPPLPEQERRSDEALPTSDFRLPTFPSARGSVRSPQHLDFYPILQRYRHLLDRFGGHPYAAGLSLPAANIPLLREALNREVRSRSPLSPTPTLTADLTLSVNDLGQPLFRALKLLEPYGIGNPTPQILLRNCWFEAISHRNLKDQRGKTVRYIKTRCQIRDESTTLGFPAVWWGHYADELPPGRCDLIGELDFNTQDKRYELRLQAVRATTAIASPPPRLDWLWDWRSGPPAEPPTPAAPTAPLLVQTCPRQWRELQPLLVAAQTHHRPLALAYTAPPEAPEVIWRRLLGIAKYLSRTAETASSEAMRSSLGLSEAVLSWGWEAIAALGFQVSFLEGDRLQIVYEAVPPLPDQQVPEAIARFLDALEEEYFQALYFAQAPLTTLQQVAETWIRS